MQRNILIFLGPPGAGKGSLSRLCVKRLGWIQLSTGSLLRSHVNSQTEIGKQIDFTIKSGKLISDGLVFKMVEDWLKAKLVDSNKIILDGFPRTVAQADLFINFIRSVSDYEISFNVVKMMLSDESVVNRLSGRIVCENGSCQAVYSVDNSSLKSKCDMVCDDCFNKLSCRADDDISVVKDRLITYRKHENDLIDFYTSCGGNVLPFNVEVPLEDVYDRFLSLIGMESV